jgi:integrase
MHKRFLGGAVMNQSLVEMDLAETLSGAEHSSLGLIQAEIARSPRLASPHSRRTYAGILERFETWRQGRPVTKTLIEEYAAQLQGEDKAPATINHALSAIRWWARRLADLAMENDHLGEDRQRAIVARAERAAGVERGRHVSEGEIRALLLACAEDPSPAGVRDGAMIAVAFASGMRRSELAKLTPADVTEIEGGYELILRRAKGDKTRSVAVYNGAMEYLRDWLALGAAVPGHPQERRDPGSRLGWTEPAGDALAARRGGGRGGRALARRPAHPGGKPAGCGHGPGHGAAHPGAQLAGDHQRLR